MSQTITAADLNRGHLGMTVAFSIGAFNFKDALRGVSHEAEIVESREFFREVPRYDLGRTETRVSLLHAGEVVIKGATRVEVSP